MDTEQVEESVDTEQGEQSVELPLLMEFKFLYLLSDPQGPTRSRAGRRERQKQASPGKGETHWKSRLGVSVSTVTQKSPHVSQHSFTEIIHSALRTAGPGCAGGPTGTRDTPTTTQPQGRQAPVRSWHFRAARQAHAPPRA